MCQGTQTHRAPAAEHLAGELPSLSGPTRKSVFCLCFGSPRTAMATSLCARGVLVGYRLVPGVPRASAGHAGGAQTPRAAVLARAAARLIAARPLSPAKLGAASGPNQPPKSRRRGRARPPARSQHICPPNPWHQPARERRPLIVLLRLLHSQLGRSYSIRYRSEVMAVYNIIVIQQCRPLPQEPDAGQSLVSAAQGTRCDRCNIYKQRICLKYHSQVLSKTSKPLE